MVEPRYRIGTLALLTGLSTHVIRVWERRYGVLSPERSAGGARLYGDADVERLRLLKRVVERGHAIGQVARLDGAALARLLQPELAVLPAPSSEDFGHELVEAVKSFDRPRAERILARASATFSPSALLFELLSPALRRVGDEWASGRLCVASEHLASALVRDHAGAMLHEYATAAGEQVIVTATPAGELHELGALLAAVMAAIQGFRVVYLGPNLPAAEIAEAARKSGAKIVLLSIVALDPREARREVRALRRALPSRAELVIGGAQAAAIARDLRGVAAPLGDLPELQRFLEAKQAPEARGRPPRNAR